MFDRTKYLFVIFIVQIFLISNVMFPCTVFFASNGCIVLGGNNEDGSNPNTKVWFLPPEDGKYGRVYFGYDNFVPQGGMNDQGLFFDFTATPPLEVVQSKGKEIYKGNLMDKIMEECATVEEALKVFDKYNLQSMRRSQTFIGDRKGNSAIIEGDEILRKTGKYQALTNFYQSKVKSGEYPCERYNIALEMLEKNKNKISVDLFRRILAAVHQEGEWKTLYSNIYDLKQGIIYLYHFHNFEEMVKIDLEEELNKGKHTYDLPSLFPRLFAAEQYQQKWKNKIKKKKEEIKKQKASRLNTKVDPKTYNSYVGEYKLLNDKDKSITIKKEGDKLYFQMEGTEKMELWPEAEGRFFNISLQITWRLFLREFKFIFEKDKSGEVTELTIITNEGKKISAITL